MARKLKVDMTGVSSFVKAEEGSHIAKIDTITNKPSKAGNDMLTMSFLVTKGESKDAKVFDNFPLTDTALWKLKQLLQAVGMKAEGKISLDLDKLEGKAVKIEVYHEEYDGKMRAKISEYSALKKQAEPDEEDFEDDEEEEETPPPKKKAPAKKRKKKPEPEPEPEEEDDEDDYEDDDDWEEDED